MTTLTVSRRSTLAMLGTAAAAATVAACGSRGGSNESSTTSLRVVWWGDDTRTRATLEMFEVITESHPDIRLAGEGSGYDGYFEKLSTQMAGGGGPDILQMNLGAPLQQFGSRSALAVLDDYVGDVLDLDDYVDYVDYGRIGGDLVGIPLSRSAFAAVYVPDQLDDLGVAHPAEGWTWDDFEETCRQIVDASDGALTGSVDGSGMTVLYEMWHYGIAGTDLYTADGQRADDADLVAQWFEMWRGLRSDGLIVSPDIQADVVLGDTPHSPLVTGRSGLAFDYSTTFPTYDPLLGSPAAMQTAPESGDHPAAYVSPTSMWAVNANSESVEAAVLVINELINNPEALAVQGMTRGVPISASAVETIRPGLDDTTAALVDFTAALGERDLRVLATDLPSGAADVDSEFGLAAQEVAFGRMDPGAAAATFVEQSARHL